MSRDFKFPVETKIRWESKRFPENAREGVVIAHLPIDASANAVLRSLRPDAPPFRGEQDVSTRPRYLVEAQIGTSRGAPVYRYFTPYAALVERVMEEAAALGRAAAAPDEPAARPAGADYAGKVLERVDQVLAAMAKHPRAWNGAAAIVIAARLAMELRALLLGAERDLPPGHPGSILGALVAERYGETSASAASFLSDEADGADSIGEFLREWYRREKLRVPDHPSAPR